MLEILDNLPSLQQLTIEGLEGDEEDKHLGVALTATSDDVEAQIICKDLEVLKLVYRSSAVTDHWEIQLGWVSKVGESRVKDNLPLREVVLMMDGFGSEREGWDNLKRSLDAQSRALQSFGHNHIKVVIIFESVTEEVT